MLKSLRPDPQIDLRNAESIEPKTTLIDCQMSKEIGQHKPRLLKETKGCKSLKWLSDVGKEHWIFVLEAGFILDFQVLCVCVWESCVVW